MFWTIPVIPKKTIAVAQKLINEKVSNSIRYDALRFLAYAYKSKGDFESAQKAIDKLPDINFTKLTETAFLANGETKLDAAQKQKRVSFENLIQMIWKTAEYYIEINCIEKALFEIQAALNLVRTYNDPYFETYIDFFKKQKELIENKL